MGADDSYTPPAEIIKVATWVGHPPINWVNYKLQNPNKITLHHSYKPDGLTMSNDDVLRIIEGAHARRVHGLQPVNQMQYKEWQKQYPNISYHYIIFGDGSIIQTRWETAEWRATQNNNVDAIHILIVWDFVNNKPTSAQYKKLNETIAIIQSRWNIKVIKWHGQFPGEKTSCPGPQFDYMKVDQIKRWTDSVVKLPSATPKAVIQAPKPKANSKCKPWQVRFDQITAYYTPIDDWWLSHGTLEASRKVNGDFINAMGRPYTDDHKYTHWACWKKYKKGTKMYIEWRWEVVCSDRWSAIDDNDFDIYYWVWKTALANIRWWKIHPQEACVTIY